MGGILPQEDIPKLIEAGIAKCFTTGVGLLDIVEAVRGDGAAAGGGGGRATPAAQLARDISLPRRQADAGGASRAGRGG
jgi:hypothetical protein